MNYQQVACQQETWIGLESPHTMPAFLKKVWLWERGTKMPEHMVSIESKYWLAPAGGAELQWVSLMSEIAGVEKTINCADWLK